MQYRNHRMFAHGMTTLQIGDEQDEDDVPTGKYTAEDIEQAIESSRRSSPPELPATGT